MPIGGTSFTRNSVVRGSPPNSVTGSNFAVIQEAARQAANTPQKSAAYSRFWRRYAEYCSSKLTSLACAALRARPRLPGTSGCNPCG